MKLTKSFKSFLLETKWVQNVKPKWTPPEGTFAKNADPKKSAEIICKGHKGDLKSSVASVNYFFNRGGICKQGNEHYDAEWCKLKDKIIKSLNEICK